MRYAVQLSWRMLLALVDINEGNDDPDSPRRNGLTLGALQRRQLVTLNGERLTKKGRAYLEVALFEYNNAIEALKEAA